MLTQLEVVLCAHHFLFDAEQFFLFLNQHFSMINLKFQNTSYQ